MTLNLVSNSGLAGNKGSKAISAIGAGGVGNANFTNTATGTYSSGGINYKYITFAGNGTLTIDEPGLADVLVVAGGGGASGNAYGRRGSGGAGGYKYAEKIFFAVGSHSVVIGGGGGGSGNGAGAVGADSYIYTGQSWIDARGGGGGGGAAPGPYQGNSGGSTGGEPGITSGHHANLRPVPTQGNYGAIGDADHRAGGGAGGVGSGSTAGPGIANSITGSSITYSTGGGGTSSIAGAANRGQGGGSPGAAGGSGIIVVRVQI